MLKIAQREEGRLKQEIIRLNKELGELKERRNIYEVNRVCVCACVYFLLFFVSHTNCFFMFNALLLLLFYFFLATFIASLGYLSVNLL